MTAPSEPRDRLDPEVLRQDARTLLAVNGDDPVPLVVSLLRQVRENDDRQQAIRDGYGASYRHLREEFDRVCDERNMYREAVRLVKRATRNVPVGR